MREIPHSYAKAPKRGFRPRLNALFKAFRKGFVSCCESKVPKGKKYKPCVFSGVLSGLENMPVFSFFVGFIKIPRGRFSRHKRKRMFCIPLRNKNAGCICAKSALRGSLFDYKA